MKKIFYFATLAFLAMGMVACDKDNDEPNPGPTPGPTPGGGDGVELVTGDYVVSMYTDAEGTASEDLMLKVSGQNGAYTLENLFNIGGISLICTYSATDGTLTTDGSFEVSGQTSQVFGYYWGLENSQTGEVSQAFAILSFIDPQGNAVADPMIIYTNKETGELAEFGSNLMLLLAPASLQNNQLVVDEENAQIAGVIVTGMPLSRVSATTSLSSVLRAPMTIAPVAPVKVNR
ncbi:hypothetical protein [uncultured Alistipes sp.]|uniref:hypothetical protein n=1 Tax=uncultured Alistipes sp. TaxID=538949 RepID=UPI00260BE4EE|nr:hypothetical protein [uncultured Alistipes sp.]